MNVFVVPDQESLLLYLHLDLGNDDSDRSGLPEATGLSTKPVQLTTHCVSTKGQDLAGRCPEEQSVILSQLKPLSVKL